MRQWHRNINLLRPRTLFNLGHHFLLILPLLLFDSMMTMPERTSQRTFLNEVFIQNVESFWQTSPTLTNPMSFTVRVGSHCVTSWSHVHLCWSRSFTPTCMDLIFQYLVFSLAFEVHALLSHRRLLQICFMFLGYSFLTTQVMSVWGPCPKMSWNLLFVSTLLIGVSISSLTVRALQKALGF